MKADWNRNEPTSVDVTRFPSRGDKNLPHGFRQHQEEGSQDKQQHTRILLKIPKRSHHRANTWLYVYHFNCLLYTQIKLVLHEAIFSAAYIAVRLAEKVEPVSTD